MTSSWETWQEAGYWVDPADVPRLMAVVSRIGVWQAGQRFAWRGQSSADHILTSSLQRTPNLTHEESELRLREDETLRDARQWGLGVTRYGLLDDLQLLADLQHHGVPTHLVDMTSNPMTALWFACVHDTDVAGVLIAVNTTGWREVVPGDASATWGDMAGPRARAGATRRMSLVDESPFILRVPQPNARMAAQEGYFVSGRLPARGSQVGPIQAFDARYEIRSDGPLDLLKDPSSPSTGPLPFIAIRIQPHLKRELIEPLATTFNRTAPALFPDYQGFRDWVAQPNRTRPSPGARERPGERPRG